VTIIIWLGAVELPDTMLAASSLKLSAAWDWGSKNVIRRESIFPWGEGSKAISLLFAEIFPGCVEAFSVPSSLMLTLALVDA
jgi:hypothetical protein